MNKIIKILNNIRPDFDFAKENDFIENGLLDSFDIVTLVSDLDNEFGVSIDGADILPENFNNIEAIKNVLIKSGAKL